jgi:hypothetical protein
VIDFRRKARALLNDPEGRVATDEVLAPFIDAAVDRVPFMIASLFAMMAGADEKAIFFAAWPGAPAQKVKRQRKKKATIQK